MIDLNIASGILLGSFFVSIFFGFNIAYALGLSSMLTALFLQMPMLTVVQIIISKLGNFTLLAVPFFIMAGELMGVGGISDRLIELSKSIVGWMRGGLAQVNIVASMFFGGISGSAAADTASLGAILIPMMEKDGYDSAFSTNITMASSVQGILIPPSHNLVIFAVAAGGVSIAELFMAGIVPGLLLGLSLMIFTFFQSKKHNYPKGEKFSLRVFLGCLRKSIWALGTVIIVVGGVLSGVFTATESAAFAVIYAFIVTYFVYREAKLNTFWGVLSRTIKTLSNILILTSCATAFSFFITYLRIPQALTTGLLSITSNKYLILLMINVLLLVLGTFMNMISIILIMTPILLPIVTTLGMTSIQFGVILILNLGIGLLTPPVGTVLFVGSSVSGVPIEELGKKLLPILGVMVIALMLVTFVPAISMGLPHLLYDAEMTIKL